MSDIEQMQSDLDFIDRNLDAIIAENKRLRETLPQTRDGVTVTNGMTIWLKPKNDSFGLPPRKVRAMLVVMDEYGVSETHSVAECFSTYEAACEKRQVGR